MSNNDDTILAQTAEIILDTAAESRLGIKVKPEFPNDDVITPALRARAILYRFRRELPKPEYKNLVFRLSPISPDTHLWILKKPDKEEPEIAPLIQPLNVEY